MLHIKCYFILYIHVRPPPGAALTGEKVGAMSLEDLFGHYDAACAAGCRQYYYYYYYYYDYYY